MTQNLTPAQQAHIDNRDATGQWKQKTHGEVDPGTDPLGLEDSETSGITLSYEERQVLVNDSMDRARYHEASEQAHFEELAGHLDDDRTFNEAEAYEGQLQDYVADADRHNAYVAAKIAFSAEPEATVARIRKGQPPEFYDRNGDVVDDPEAARIHAEFHQDHQYGISMVPSDMRHHQKSELGGPAGSEWLDLEAARADSDVHHSGGVDLGAPPRSDEAKALQARANLRRLTEDDVVYEGDRIQSGSISGTAVGTVFDAGANDIQILTDRGIQTADGETAFTDRQRDIDTDAEDTAGVPGVEDTFVPATNDHVETIDDEFPEDEPRRTAIRNSSEIIEEELPTDEQTGALEEAVEAIRGGDTDGPTIAGRAIRFAQE